jgi:Zn-finger nucleic acid-binding protein
MEKKVLIDSCSKNHGLWFDRGELDQLLEIGGIENDSKIYSFLKDLFGKKVLK